MSLRGGLSLSLQEPSETLWLLWKPQPQISEEGILSVQVTAVRAGSLVVRAPVVLGRSIPGLYLLDASSTLPLSGDNQQCLQVLPDVPCKINHPLVFSSALTPAHSTGMDYRWRSHLEGGWPLRI